MEIVKKYLSVLIFTAIVVILWVGFLLISRKPSSSINPNVQEYTKPLKSSFDEEILKDVSKRVKETFAIPPSSFFEMVETEDLQD